MPDLEHYKVLKMTAKLQGWHDADQKIWAVKPCTDTFNMFIEYTEQEKEALRKEHQLKCWYCCTLAIKCIELSIPPEDSIKKMIDLAVSELILENLQKGIVLSG